MTELGSILGKVKGLLDEVNSDEELKAKVTTTLTHFNSFEVERPKVDNKTGRIMVYLSAIGDIGKVSIPIIFVAEDATRAEDIAEVIHEFISEYVLRILKSVYDAFRVNADKIKSPNDAFPIIAQILADILTIATEERFNKLAETISSNIISYKIVSDLSDEETYELVIVEPARNADVNEVSKITTNLLAFVDRLWNVFLKPLVSSLSSGS